MNDLGAEAFILHASSFIVDLTCTRMEVNVARPKKGS
jgi:hypothetical protein